MRDKADGVKRAIVDPDIFRFLALSGRGPLVRLACFDAQAAVNAFACSYRHDCERESVSLVSEMLTRGYAKELMLLYTIAADRNYSLAEGRREALKILRMENAKPYKRMLKRKKKLNFMETELKAALDSGDSLRALKLSRCAMRGFRRDVIRVGRMKLMKASAQSPLWALYCAGGIMWYCIEKGLTGIYRDVRDMLFPKGALKRRFMEGLDLERDF